MGARLLIGQHSSGIPRNINNLCFHAMGLASAVGRKQVDSQMVGEVIRDLSLESSPAAMSPERAERTVVPFRAVAADNAARRKAGRLIPAALIASAVLFLGLVSGASWKTDAGSFATAHNPSPNAAAFPVPMPSVASAPETLPSFAASSSLDGLSPVVPNETVASHPESQAASVVGVTVEKNVTLRHLCLLYLNRFDQRTIAAIQYLNSEIADPNRLQAGQRIRLPLYLRRDSPYRPPTGPGEKPAMEKPNPAPGGQP